MVSSPAASAISEPAHLVRANFWQRISALIVDGLIILTMVTLIGVTLSKITGGEIRVQSTIIKSPDCRTLDALPNGLELPRDFKPTSITACTYSFLSIPYNWDVTAKRGGQQDFKVGDTEYTASKKLSYTFPLTPSGIAAQPIEIDEYAFVLYGFYFIALEWLFGGTLAQRFFCMRVRSVSGGPASLIQIVKRFTIRFGWLLLIPIGQHLAYVLPDHMIAILVGLSASNLAIVLALVVNARRTMRKGELAWHDRWAQTEVVCT